MLPPARLFVGAVLALTLSLGQARTAAGQQPGFAFELRGGATLPRGPLEGGAGWGGEAESGPTLGAAFTLRLAGPLALRLGFSELRFGCPGPSCADDGDLIATGFDVGGDLRLGSGRIMPYVRASWLGYLAETQVQGEGGELRTVRSDRASGWEAGAGIRVNLTARWSIAPSVRYGELSVNVPSVGELPLDFWVAEVTLFLDF